MTDRGSVTRSRRPLLQHPCSGSGEPRAAVQGPDVGPLNVEFPIDEQMNMNFIRDLARKYGKGFGGNLKLTLALSLGLLSPREDALEPHRQGRVSR